MVAVGGFMVVITTHLAQIFVVTRSGGKGVFCSVKKFHIDETCCKVITWFAFKKWIFPL